MNLRDLAYTLAASLFLTSLSATAYADMDGVTLKCYSGGNITTVVMKNTNNYAVNIDFINGTVPSRLLLTEDESHKLRFSLVQCSPTLVTIKKVTKA